VRSAVKRVVRGRTGKTVAKKVRMGYRKKKTQTLDVKSNIERRRKFERGRRRNRDPPAAGKREAAYERLVSDHQELSFGGRKQRHLEPGQLGSNRCSGKRGGSTRRNEMEVLRAKTLGSPRGGKEKVAKSTIAARETRLERHEKHCSEVRRMDQVDVCFVERLVPKEGNVARRPKRLKEKRRILSELSQNHEKTRKWQNRAQGHLRAPISEDIPRPTVTRSPLCGTGTRREEKNRKNGRVRKFSK